MNFNNPTLKKVTSNPSNAMLAEAVNRLVDEMRRTKLQEGENIRLTRTPVGTIINAKSVQVTMPVETPEQTGDLRFS